MKKFVLAGLSTVFLSSLCAAGQLAGVTMPDTVQVSGKTLKLNGAGVRRKMVIRVYVCALYLENNSKDAAAIIASNETKSMHLKMMRAVEGPKISGAMYSR